MATDKKKFSKNLLVMCIVPILVLVVTMSIIGVTFAWFNDAEQTTIATLNLTTSQTFKMTFDIITDENGNSTITDSYDQAYIYKGETAFDSNGMLVTDIHAIESGLEVDSIEYNQYMNDEAFVAPFKLKLDTGTYWTTDKENDKAYVHRYAVDFNCIIESVHIYNSENEAIEIKLPNDNGTPDDLTDDITPEDIKLGFTWFISGANEMFTPYGRFSSTQRANSTTGGALANKVQNWDIKQPIKDFDTYVLRTTEFEFNIVFAPEKLYWMQYGSTNGKDDQGNTIVGDYNKSAFDIYGNTFKSDKWNAINRYSSIIYSGSTYSFTVLLTVEHIDSIT